MLYYTVYSIQYTAPSSASHSFLSSADTPAAPPDTQRSGTTGGKKHVSMNGPTEVLKLTHKEIKILDRYIIAGPGYSGEQSLK